MAESLPPQESLSRTLAGGSEYSFDYVCQPCSEDNKTLEAVGLCVTCTELLCDECFRYHLKPTPSRHHKLLGLEDAKKDQNFAVSRDMCTETCRQHPQEIIKYFCKTHNILGCSACMTVEHRSCKGVQHIPKVAEAEANGQEYTGLVQELDTVLLRTRRLIKDSTDNKAKSQQMCDRALDDVIKAEKDVMEAFQKLKRNIQKEADKTKNKQIQKMDENIAVFDNIQQRAETLTKTFKSMKTNGQYCKLFTAMKVEKSGIHSLDAKLDKAANDNTVADFKFQPCRELEELLKRKDSLGNICQHDSDTGNTARLGKQSQVSNPSRKVASSVAKAMMKLPQDSVKGKATKVGEINVKTDGDTVTCCIYGLVSLPNGRLVAADNYYEKVKLIDVQQARVVSALDLPGSPRDMTATDEPGQIAVTLGNQNKIVVVKVTGDSLLKDREIQTSSSCYGIASIKGNLVVSLASPERLEIIDKHGTVLRRIEHDQKGKQLFHDVYSIAASPQGDAIYVPDYDKNTVTCLSASGEVKAVHTHSELRSARGAAVDQRGAVYVAGRYSNNILQIIPDSRKVSELLSAKDGIADPRSLCYSADTDRLFVGQYDSNSILVYQLS